MATESVIATPRRGMSLVTVDRTSENPSQRIETAAASIDGVAAILSDMVQSEDAQIARAAYACCDLLERISEELDQVAVNVRKLEPKA